MFTHTAEAFVPAAHAECVGEQVRVRIHDYCLTIHTSGTHWLLDFGDGRACLKATREGLRVRIKARDLVTFYGIRTILQGCLLAAAPEAVSAMAWQLATNPSRQARDTLAGSRRSRPCGV